MDHDDDGETSYNTFVDDVAFEPTYLQAVLTAAGRNVATLAMGALSYGGPACRCGKSPNTWPPDGLLFGIIPGVDVHSCGSSHFTTDGVPELQILRGGQRRLALYIWSVGSYEEIDTEWVKTMVNNFHQWGQSTQTILPPSGVSAVFNALFEFTISCSEIAKKSRNHQTQIKVIGLWGVPPNFKGMDSKFLT